MDLNNFLEENMRDYPPLRQIKNMKMLSHTKAMIRRAIAMDREDRGDAVARLEKLAENGGIPKHVQDWTIDEYGNLTVYFGNTRTTTIPAAIKAAEKEFE